MNTVIYRSFKSFLGRADRSLNEVSPEFAKENPNHEKDNASNIGCWNCIDCSECLYLGMPYPTPA